MQKIADFFAETQRGKIKVIIELKSIEKISVAHKKQLLK